jgi:pimeloyl-ACP methyl ester carboxylesterase
MSAFILVHGAWHDGSLLEETAAPIRAAGHDVFLPTLSGNGKNDPKHVGLEDAIQSLTDFITEQNINDAILVAHSYGGMVITGVADRLPERFRRLVYWNAFVPNNGECLNDLVPQFYIDLFDQIVQDDGSVMLPFPVWREAFINDASLELATETYKKLNSQPYQTFKDAITLSKNPAELHIPKSYINGSADTAMPHSLPWHPRLSEKLGLFRLVQSTGSHELCFSNPTLLASKILEAARD